MNSAFAHLYKPQESLSDIDMQQIVALVGFLSLYQLEQL